MPVQFSKAAVIEKNMSAIKASQAVIGRLEQMVGLPSSLEKKRLAQLARAKNLITNLRAVNTHLKAAGTTVQPMSDATAEELNALGNKLDEQIAADAITNATIDFIKSVLDDVNRLQGIAAAHQG